MARSLRNRLIFDLARNREELIMVVTPIEDLDYAPAEGMKDYRAQLVEIGSTELETVALVTTGNVPNWKELEAKVPGASLAELLGSLGAVREDLLQCLGSLTDEDLVETVEIPPGWASFHGDVTLEREELFRWLARHEYYHIGQIVTYRWLQGFNPYK